MSYEILAAENPVRRSENMIDLTLTLKTPQGKVKVPFSAVPNDSEEHGRILYQNANDGLYGPVQEGKEE